MKAFQRLPKARLALSSLNSPSKLFIRQSSTNESELEISAKQEVGALKRKFAEPTISYDYLTPTSSHLLNLTLADILPEECWAPNFSASDLTLPVVGDTPLPEGHHLVYCPPQLLARDLLEDGTDNMHHPGRPFTRRLWTSGNLRFHSRPEDGLPMKLDGRRVFCREKIRRINIGNDLAQITILRHIGYAPENTSPLKFVVAISETRDFRFFTDKAEAKAGVGHQYKPRRDHNEIKAFSFTPTPSLLARFSALTFNAHRIHLDVQYSQVEGYKSLLLHGPLLAMLMLAALRPHVEHGNSLRIFGYRLLRPVYVNEKIDIIVQKTGREPTNGDYSVMILVGGVVHASGRGSSKGIDEPYKELDDAHLIDARLPESL
ncbi:hypothetical protein BJ875DRAFT_215884 [Amylocarpus encephaloides]|uniref:MaoC-like domain-containing protein n=1 Tax=Amylocarpus encephaloides TaxID=45428 RepID=A0A9P8C7E3_9HELO|nr:hypothetical protein BJ875DRAFT_215884 [Amylocarpus encephaloides]